jgi:hypothetical protein
VLRIVPSSGRCVHYKRRCFFSTSVRFIDKDTVDLYLQMYINSKIGMSEEKMKLKAENRRGKIYNNGRYRSLLFGCLADCVQYWTKTSLHEIGSVFRIFTRTDSILNRIEKKTSMKQKTGRKPTAIYLCKVNRRH